MDLNLIVNGKQESVTVTPNATLLHVLREQLMLTGTKEGCGAGQCGACTVLLDGRPVNACLVLAADAQGKEVWTIEGMAHGDKLHPLQQSFIDNYAIQCGFCTPGMIMTAAGLLKQNADPTEGEIKQAIKGNVCRCTGYRSIIEAIRKAAEKGAVS
jgi:carbon-monoxide dehydrogenase small subunit